MIKTSNQFRSKNILKVFNPARPDEIFRAVSVTPMENLEEIIKVTKESQNQWKMVPVTDRIALVETLLAKISDQSEALAETITWEQGKPLKESRAEIMKSISEAHCMCQHVFNTGVSVAPSKSNVRNMIIRRPRGVIVAITPWNFPILTPMRKVIPAILWGNSVILKPSEYTPTASLILERIFKEVLPEKVFQVIIGKSELGSALCQKKVDGISFTGSVATGRKIAEVAARNLTELSLELGGKNSVIVNDTKNIDQVVKSIISSAMQCSGQRCTAISRVIVLNSIADQLVSSMVEECKTLKIGDGMEKGTDLGPITTESQLNKILEWIKIGKTEGAKIIFGGEVAKIPKNPKGWFFTPTIFDGVTSKMRIAQEEIFGPVVGVLRYHSFDEAMEMVNDHSFGLSAALFSNQNDLINRFIDEVKSGMIHINQGTVPDSHMPFGGIGNSGMGAYSVGQSSSSFYTTEHSIYNQYLLD